MTIKIAMEQNTSEENLSHASVHSFMLKVDLLYIFPCHFLIIKQTNNFYTY